MSDKVKMIIDEVVKVVKGKDEQIAKILTVILAEGHVLLEDIPGVGKTTIALAFSKALGIDFNRIQFTPDVVPSDIVGFTMYEKDLGAFVYREGAVMSNLVLADEINRTSSRTQAALLEVMEEKNITIDGETHSLPQPFNVIATQNPIGSHGTQELPQSQLDRFMMKISIGYPDFDSQVELLLDRQTTQPLDLVELVVTKSELIELQNEVKQIHIAEEIIHYITELTELTRNHPYIVQGVSPRGALALSRVAKSKAYVEGRDYVVPEDVMESFIDTCNHRIVIDPKMKIKYDNSSQILEEIMLGVNTPDIQLERTF